MLIYKLNKEQRAKVESKLITLKRKDCTASELRTITQELFFSGWVNVPAFNCPKDTWIWYLPTET